MTRSITSALEEADLILMVSAGRTWSGADQKLAQSLPGHRTALLAINKIDRLEHTEQLLPLVDRLRAEHRFAEFLPISAQSGHGVDELIRSCVARMPSGPAPYADDALTDRSERFIAAETIREKLFRLVGDEVPYGSTVIIDRFIEQPKLRTIDATIIVERSGHQPIIVGPKGARIKQIGTQARIELERVFGTKVFLQLWVKRKRGWADSEQSLRAYGYE
jgi:GTP-binding protein Era